MTAQPPQQILDAARPIVDRKERGEPPAHLGGGAEAAGGDFRCHLSALLRHQARSLANAILPMREHARDPALVPMPVNPALDGAPVYPTVAATASKDCP